MSEETTAPLATEPQPALLAGVEHLRQADPIMAGLIDTFGIVQRRRDRPPFYALMASIVSQQISVKAAAAIMGRLEALFPEGQAVRAAAVLAIPPEQLRAVGLSAAKVRYMYDLAEKVASDVVDLDRLPQLPDEEIIEALCRIKGIGRWTAEMFLMFSLGRLDVLPVDDLGLRASIQRNYGFEQLPKAAEIRPLAEPWRPYRSIATFYLWESLHNTPKV